METAASPRGFLARGHFLIDNLRAQRRRCPVITSSYQVSIKHPARSKTEENRRSRIPSPTCWFLTPKKKKKKGQSAVTANFNLRNFRPRGSMPVPLVSSLTPHAWIMCTFATAQENVFVSRTPTADGKCKGREEADTTGSWALDPCASVN